MAKNGAKMDQSYDFMQDPEIQRFIRFKIGNAKFLLHNLLNEVFNPDLLLDAKISFYTELKLSYKALLKGYYSEMFQNEQKINEVFAQIDLFLENILKAIKYTRENWKTFLFISNSTPHSLTLSNVYTDVKYFGFSPRLAEEILKNKITLARILDLNPYILLQVQTQPLEELIGFVTFKHRADINHRC